jgi:hypothetical protein
MTAAASLRLLTLVLLAVLGFASQPAAANPCTDTNPPYTPYTLKIFNDTTLSNIYPVIATPTNDADEWLQGGFQIQDSQKTTLTYAHQKVYRIYIQPTVGIPPGGSVTVTLPLCSELVKNPVGTVGHPDEYIDWWNGGRVYIYDNLVSAGKPPPALTLDLTNDQKYPVVPLTPGPSCVGCPNQYPPIWRSNPPYRAPYHPTIPPS